jgi:flagellar motor switch protein FliN/FliY
MTEKPPVQPDPALDGTLRPFLEVCGGSLGKMFEQSGRPGTMTVLPVEGPAAGEKKDAENVAVRFAASGALRGEFTFHVSPAAAVRIAQALLGEASGGPVECSAEHRDACEEFFRQAAGLAATASAALAGGAVEYRQPTEKKAGANAARSSGWSIARTGEPPLEIHVGLDAELVESLRQKAEVKAASGAATQPSSAAPAAASTAAVTEANLGLVLDVVLDASLRFGQKLMMLKDVLELRPGSIVELDRQVQDPAELLVAGRVIAKGEVVVVDGNYGLRITEVAQPRDRLESFEA